MLHDEIEKKRRGYANPKSIVWPDGREKLAGYDWSKRKIELWTRAGGRCEQINSDGVRCRTDGHDPHHKVMRSKKRDDRLENLELLCRLHHELKDKRKVRLGRIR